MRLAFAPTVAALLLAGCASMSSEAPVAPQSATLSPLPANIPSDLPRIARPSHYAITVTPDAANLRFAASSAVDFELFEPSDKVTLSANGLRITDARLVPATGGDPIAMNVTTDPEAQTATFAAPAALAPGRYRLETNYTGPIGTQANGLFALDYPDKRTGKSVRALFTQFEAPDARRFAPTFDEPSYKATFDLTAIVPQDQMAVSNMPFASETPLGDGRKRVVFRTTPKMSSYLLFFGLGDFERLTKMASDGTEVGIVQPAGSGEQGRFALDELAKLPPYFGDYFGVRFPLPKLDNIAGPGSSQFFGAMENWGAIFTFERILLDDPAITSPGTRQAISEVQAHETAHQWFGDLVTMAWWDDLWLNEGFASWMQTKTTAHFHPDWYPLLTRVGGREAAMGLDSFATTHPVVQKIRSVAETNQAFDAITYQKGEAVISMLEAYAGEDVWREGLRRYMRDHAYSNTQSDDLWNAIEAAGAPGLTSIAHDFTLKPGIPLVRVDSASCTGGGTQVTLSQSEFSRDRMKEAAANPQQWRVPLLLSHGSGAGQRQILQGQGTYTVAGCGPLIVNGGQLGYFRTLYTAPMLAELTKALPKLQPIDQLGLLADNMALSNAGYQSMAPALDLLAAVPRDANPLVATDAIGRLAGIYQMLETATDASGARSRLLAIAKDRFGSRLQALGYEPRANEPVAEANLRIALLGAFAEMGDPAVVAEARRRFAGLRSDPKALDGPLKTTWLGIAARNASRADWEQFVRLAESSGSSVERSTYWTLAGATKDEALARAALKLALTDRPGATNSSPIISAVSRLHPELAYDFVIANRAKVDPLVDASARTRFIAGLAGRSEDPAMIAKLQALRASLPANERRPVDQALTSLQYRIERTPRVQQELLAWLASH
ncbi:aminopeptidase [Tsuneonella deserti]|uniref:Aminopeptidase n=1 Tax=Tsuneonella deserti TaxID=2035528 RepID=A0ABQ1RYD0_9SPHN|nr:M1 family metallopeptidase [Tsuneonella deserti]GGD84947.1 aminopeptidase [Tsuneonella deserti]